MAYESAAELPTGVRSSFSETDQLKWMEAYNAALGGATSAEAVKAAKEKAWRECFALPSSFAVEVWASVDATDADGENVDIDSVAAFCDAMIDHGGRMNIEHTNVPGGEWWAWRREKNPQTGTDGIILDGNLYGGSKTFDENRQEFLRGMNSVSIGGDASYGGQVCDEKGCYTKRIVDDLYEVSLTGNPANPYATLIKYNEAFAKSRHEGVLLKVYRLEVHTKDDTEHCPLKKRAEVLTEALPYCNIVNTGSEVRVYADSDRDELRAMRKMDRLGMVYNYHGDDGSFSVRDLTAAVAKHRAEGLKAGWCTADGRILAKAGRETFCRLYMDGLIEKSADGAYRFRAAGPVRAETVPYRAIKKDTPYESRYFIGHRAFPWVIHTRYVDFNALGDNDLNAKQYEGSMGDLDGEPYLFEVLFNRSGGWSFLIDADGMEIDSGEVTADFPQYLDRFITGYIEQNGLLERRD